jgi:hypothetical protein
MLLVAIEGDKSEQIFSNYQNLRMISDRYLAKSQQCLNNVNKFKLHLSNISASSQYLISQQHLSYTQGLLSQVGQSQDPGEHTIM